MSWVVDQAGSRTAYNTNRSAFWRVIRRTCRDLVDGAHEFPEWSSHICWTNLFKVSPSKGRNPTGTLSSSQREAAAELLAQELFEWRPTRVLVLTGWSWFAPFAPRLGVHLRRTAALVDAVEAVGTSADCRWVIAKHPERKPEDAAVEQILRHFA